MAHMHCVKIVRILLELFGDKLIVAGRGSRVFSRVAGFVAGRGFLTKIAGF